MLKRMYRRTPLQDVPPEEGSEVTVEAGPNSKEGVPFIDPDGGTWAHTSRGYHCRHPGPDPPPDAIMHPNGTYTARGDTWTWVAMDYHQSWHKITAQTKETKTKAPPTPGNTANPTGDNNTEATVDQDYLRHSQDGLLWDFTSTAALPRQPPGSEASGYLLNWERIANNCRAKAEKKPIAQRP